MASTKSSGGTEIAVAAGGVALLASILANVKQLGDNRGLERSVAALQNMVQDWQTAYGELEAQLALALRSNTELNGLVTSLRQEKKRLQDRAHMSEKRALDAEAELARANEEIKRLKADAKATEKAGAASKKTGGKVRRTANGKKDS